MELILNTFVLDHETSNTSPEERTSPSVGSQKNLKLGLGVAPDNKENRGKDLPHGDLHCKGMEVEYVRLAWDCY